MGMKIEESGNGMSFYSMFLAKELNKHLGRAKNG